MRWGARQGSVGLGVVDRGDHHVGALPDGSYAIGGGLIVMLPVRFARDSDGIMHMELVGLEAVRRTNGFR